MISSIICTPNDQQVAYAVKDQFRDDLAACETERKQVRHGRKDNRVDVLAALIRGLLNCNGCEFVNTLEAYLRWHGLRAHWKRNVREPKYLLGTGGLGLCRLAVMRGVCTINQSSRLG